MKPKIQVRKLEEQDFDSLINDLNPWAYKKRGQPFLEWLNRCPSHEGISLVAILDSKVIAYYGTITVPLKVGDQTVFSYRGGIFVHPNFRRNPFNLLNLLVRAMHAEIKKNEGVTYGFPIFRLVKYYTKRIKIISLKTIPRYIFILKVTYVFGHFLKHEKTLNFIGRRFEPLMRYRLGLIKIFAPSEVEVVAITFFDKRFDALWEKASSTHLILSTRTAEFLNWRYFDEPGKRYMVFAAKKEGDILGFIILKEPEAPDPGKGVIVDLLDLQNPRITKALILHAIHYFEIRGVDRIEFFVSNPYYEKILKSTCFLKRPNNPRGAERLFAKSYAPGIKKGTFENPSHWFITTADMMFA